MTQARQYPPGEMARPWGLGELPSYASRFPPQRELFIQPGPRKLVSNRNHLVPPGIPQHPLSELRPLVTLTSLLKGHWFCVDKPYRPLISLSTFSGYSQWRPFF